MVVGWLVGRECEVVAAAGEVAAAAAVAEAEAAMAAVAAVVEDEGVLAVAVLLSLLAVVSSSSVVGAAVVPGRGLFASLHSIALTYTRWLLDYLLLQLDLLLRLPRQTWP